MNPLFKTLSAFAILLAAAGCSTTQSDHGSSRGMRQAEATQSPDADENVNCAPGKIGAAAGQGSDCRHGTGGAASTPPDSSSSNDPNAPTSPPH